MENTRKNDLLMFLDYVPDGNLVGVYYVDKVLDLIHYSVYEKSDFGTLKEKIELFNDDLDDSVMQILSWEQSDSEPYLVGVYDGLVKEHERVKVENE